MRVKGETERAYREATRGMDKAAMFGDFSPPPRHFLGFTERFNPLAKPKAVAKPKRRR